ncbi:MAG: hypothetical protein COW04_03355 [Deltaproteobacteria bacterium CG12_big_fil_rev_8_21_14_0_65_43_10]|nr:MAG: hypothetical protein AUJ48_04795 [Deltaproteobacteria bacterium CG1_02_45_11]PIQ46219.1 MAG: hypothetical protein COW04_03355 [Deltaproteobacteria bacterium CG12_big_fil_rev_8_21_14_0_65_43_10]
MVFFAITYYHIFAFFKEILKAIVQKAFYLLTNPRFIYKIVDNRCENEKAKYRLDHYQGQ